MSGASSPPVLAGRGLETRAHAARRRSVYPWFLALGCFAGLVAGSLTPSARAMGAPSFAVAASLLIVPAVIGSRIWFVLLNWRSFRGHPAAIWRRSDGGMALYGGLILAFVLSIPLLAAMDLPFWSFWDAASVTMLVGLIITRFGCTLNGCCRGVETTRWFGLRLPDERGNRRRRVPTQLIEAGWGALALGVAVLIEGHLPFAGFLFLAVLAGYSGLRLAMDRARAERMGLTAQHAVAAVLVLATAALSVGLLLS